MHPSIGFYLTLFVVSSLYTYSVAVPPPSSLSLGQLSIEQGNSTLINSNITLTASDDDDDVKPCDNEGYVLNTVRRHIAHPTPDSHTSPIPLTQNSKSFSAKSLYRT